MSKVTVFNSVSTDGYFTDEKGDMSWAHKHDPEWIAFTSQNASGASSSGGGSVLLFGRVTYELMQSYWPTPQAQKDLPDVAESMNNLPKIVFSNTLDQAAWKNTKLVKGDIAAEVSKMKQESGRDMVIMGSGTIVAQLTVARLIDEYQIVLNPVVLGRGRTMFEGVKEKLNLKLTKSRPFSNGNVVLWYERAA